MHLSVRLYISTSLYFHTNAIVSIPIYHLFSAASPLVYSTAYYVCTFFFSIKFLNKKKKIFLLHLTQKENCEERSVSQLPSHHIFFLLVFWMRENALFTHQNMHLMHISVHFNCEPQSIFFTNRHSKSALHKKTYVSLFPCIFNAENTAGARM